MALEWKAETSRGLVRPNNEDSWAVVCLPVGRQRVWLAMVADGIGGYDGGEVASALAVDSIKEYLSKNFSRSYPGQALQEAICYSNEKIRQSAVSRESYPGMGTTLTCVMIGCDGSKALVGHVGDSRAYVVSKGEIKRVTEDHSVSGELVRNGAISEKDAMRHPGSSILTMALGTRETVQVDIYEEKLGSKDIMVLCTDGLTSLVSPDEIHHALKNYSRQEVASELVALANARGGYDNITVVILWI